ncbi:MAG: YdcF family protein [Cyanobacteria bacterium J06627_28]
MSGKQDSHTYLEKSHWPISHKRWARIGIVAGVGSLLLIGFAAGSIHFRLRQATKTHPDPQLILVLGGEPERESKGGELARSHPDLLLLISSRRPERIVYQRLVASGIERDRIRLDSTATNTLENFTTLVEVLKANNIQHVYLVTSDYHMSRAQAIGFWVFGSQGIGYTPVTVDSAKPAEPTWKIPRDIIRSWIWLLTTSHQI